MSSTESALIHVKVSYYKSMYTYSQGHFRVDITVYVHVTYPFTVAEHRDTLTLLLYSADQRVRTPGYDKIDIVGQGQEIIYIFSFTDLQKHSNV